MKKGYKVTDIDRIKKIGVAASSINELIEKSVNKLFGDVQVNVRCAECRIYVAEDGTLVMDDDYLATLPSQTLLVLLRNDEKMVTEFDYFYNVILSSKKDFIESGNAAKEFLNTNAKEKFKALQKYITGSSDAKTAISDREQDPYWFEGLEVSEKTKEQAMSKRAKERMRGYYYKTKTALLSSDIYIGSRNGAGKKLVDQFLAELRKLLETNKYNVSYFDRNSDAALRLCDSNGLFICGGLWNNASCVYEGDHTINPYRSREERIIFQTWNLDHKIELSRSIIPKIISAITDIAKNQINCSVCDKLVTLGLVESDRYYLQIFTKENLKLVHIVCHYKGKHSVDSDLYTICMKCYEIQSKEYIIN